MAWFDKKKRDLAMSIWEGIKKIRGQEKSKLFTGNMENILKREKIIHEKFKDVQDMKEGAVELKYIVSDKKDLQKELKNLPQEFFHGLPVKKSHTKIRVEKALNEEIKSQKEWKQHSKDFIKNFGGSAEFRKWKKAFERSKQGFDN